MGNNFEITYRFAEDGTERKVGSPVLLLSGFWLDDEHRILPYDSTEGCYFIPASQILLVERIVQP